MNLEKFYEELKTAGYNWKLQGYYAEGSHPHRLRAEVAPDPEKPGALEKVCPVTAVCFFLTGEYFTTYQYEQAGVELGMVHDEVKQIVAAADGSSNTGEPLERHPELLEIRARMDKAVFSEEGGAI